MECVLCPSLAMKWTRPSSRNFRAASPASRSRPSEQAPGVGLGQGAHVDELEEELGEPGEHRVPLGMGDDGNEALAHELEEQVLGP